VTLNTIALAQKAEQYSLDQKAVWLRSERYNEDVLY
jgi:hypothetical protein